MSCKKLLKNLIWFIPAIVGTGLFSSYAFCDASVAVLMAMIFGYSLGVLLFWASVE